MTLILCCGELFGRRSQFRQEPEPKARPFTPERSASTWRRLTRSGQAAGGVVMTEWYLVWVEGTRRPAPQKWSSEGLWGQIGRQDVIVRFPLTDREAELPLDELAKLHPIPSND